MPPSTTFLSSARRAMSTAARTPIPVTVANGDGVGPEIMAATLRILDAAKAPLKPEFITVGENVYKRGVSSGIDAEGWDSMARTNLLLKAPITTPLGKGVKSLNVTMRKTLGLFANVRPVFAYSPFVPSVHPKMDMVIIRENEEDLYAGIEHRHTAEVLQCIKLITIPGCERIMRYAFEYCMTHGRKRLTCVTKSNIMKLTDGAFQQIFENMAKEYPSIQTDHQIVDIATARIAAKPGNYDVVVTSNLYGDIISDVAAEVAGSVGLAGSANIGTNAAMFEAIHGSAPDIAGQNIANPCGLINASIMMLNYLKLHDHATVVHNAMLKAIEDGVHTRDIEGAHTRKRVGTKEFADAVIERLGDKPTKLAAADYTTSLAGNTRRKDVQAPSFTVPEKPVQTAPVKEFVGVDVFVDWDPATGRNPDDLARPLLDACAGDFKLSMISNRGVVVWPNGNPNTYKVDHWRCRFEATRKDVSGNRLIVDLLGRLNTKGVEVIKTENLFNFDGQAGYSKGQGQ